MTISKSWFSYLTRAFALLLCTGLLLSFVSCSDSTTSQEPKVVTSTYTVKHLLQNLQDDSYTEDEEATEQKTGTYGTQTAAVAKTYEGFTATPIEQKTIQADGTTVVEIYYDRNTYTVSYSSEYGEPPESNTVKYGYILTAADLPDLTQTNYSFNGWVYENTSIEAGYIVKTDITLTALWETLNSTYTVKHLLQNLQDDGYTEDSTEQKSGTPGTQAAAAAKSYEGFTAQTFAQKPIQADGSTVIEIKYDRNIYTISYSSTYGEPPASKPVKYGYVLTVGDLPVLPDTVLSFNGWRLDGASIEAGYTVKTDITITALWKAPTSVTKENFSAVIATLTEDSTIVVSGELSDNDLIAIAGAIQNSSYKVNLDLSQTTGLTTIPTTTFGGCSKLSGITIPESVTAIGIGAFTECIALSSVTIPDSVTRIDDNAFECCTSLSSVTIGDSVTSIGDWAFSNCEILTTITVDSNNANYSSIDGVLFNKDATALIKYPAGKQSAAYTIPNSVTSIGRYAFYGCTFLSSVTLPDSVKYIEDYAFENCTSLSSVTIPDSVTSIGFYAFASCTSLSSVTIPDSVTSIGDQPFLGCTSLESINVDSNNANYSSIAGVLFNKDATAIITYPSGKQSAAYTIPDSVTSISHEAFRDCTSLSSVTIPDSVTSIRSSAFYHCSTLSSVTIPDSVTSISWYAFDGCTALTSLTFTNPTTWYRTTSETNWNNKTNGTLTDVSAPAANATYFKDTYKGYFWYKL